MEYTSSTNEMFGHIAYALLLVICSHEHFLAARDRCCQHVPRDCLVQFFRRRPLHGNWLDCPVHLHQRISVVLAAARPHEFTAAGKGSPVAARGPGRP